MKLYKPRPCKLAAVYDITYLDFVSSLCVFLGSQVIGSLLHAAVSDPLEQFVSELGIGALGEGHLLC